MPSTAPASTASVAPCTDWTPRPRRSGVACDRVMVLDPVGAALLWLLCQRVQQSAGTRIQLTGLSEELTLKLRTHPLQDFVRTGEEIFEDPFASSQQSGR